jgi:hypothetical protein
VKATINVPHSSQNRRMRESVDFFIKCPQELESFAILSQLLPADEGRGNYG